MKKTYIVSMLVLITAALVVLYGVAMQITRSQTNSSPYASQEVQLSTAQGWTEEAETRTWTFVSANAGNNTFVVTVNEDITSFMRPSLRVRAKQGGDYLYFIVHAVELDTTNTLVTLFGGTDYTIAAGDLTDVAWSAERFPLGFPVEEDVWALEYSDNVFSTTTGMADGVLVNIGGASLTVPVGLWRLSYQTRAVLLNPTASTQVSAITALLSTNQATTTTNDGNISRSRDHSYIAFPSSTSNGLGSVLSAENIVLLVDAETAYYLKYTIDVQPDTSTVTVYVNTSSGRYYTIIRAVSGYY